MRRHLVFSFVATITFSLPTSGRAQTSPTWGLLLGTRGPGVMWRLSDNVALRQELFGSQSSINDGALSSWSVTTALSGLFYQHQHEDVRTYFGPRLGFAYLRTGASPFTYSQVLSGAVVYGAEYPFNRTFAIQGEATLAYSQSTGTRATVYGTAERVPSTRTVGAGSAIGVMYYFR